MRSVWEVTEFPGSLGSGFWSSGHLRVNKNYLTSCPFRPTLIHPALIPRYTNSRLHRRTSQVFEFRVELCTSKELSATPSSDQVVIFFHLLSRVVPFNAKQHTDCSRGFESSFPIFRIMFACTFRSIFHQTTRFRPSLVSAPAASISTSQVRRNDKYADLLNTIEQASLLKEEDEGDKKPGFAVGLGGTLLCNMTWIST